MDNMDSIDALFTAVREVQKELEKFGAKRLVDACEIFELLETHSLRSDRVQFVTTHLLVSLGLRSNFGEEDIINVPDVLNDPDVSHAVSIPTNQNDNFICDDTDSSSTWSSSSFSSPSSVAGDASKNESYPKVNKLESAFNKKCQMKVQQGKVSKSYLSVGTPSSKECNTSHVAEKVQLIDRAIKSTSSATDTKQPDIRKESSTSTSNASAEWNILYMTGITGGIDIASTANYNIQTNPIVVSDDFALKTDTSESSRPGWEVAKPGTSQADVPAGVPFLQENTVPENQSTREKSYTCETCNKKFARRTSFRGHRKTHQKDCYSCPTCNKSFYDSSNFKKHRIHTGHHPFSCNRCHKSFSDPTGLKFHKLRNH